MATGSYCAEYFPASFKGIPFDAKEVDSQHGRRGAEGEFPFGESTAYADLGRKIRRYTLSGRFVTNSHVSEASALIAAVESIGPGLLVHPTRGAVMVSCTSLKVRDNPLEERGVTYVDLEFVEANLALSNLFSGSNIFGLVIDTIVTAVRSSFLNTYKPKKARFYDVPLIIGTASSAMQALKFEFSKAIPITANDDQYQTLSDFDDIISNTSTLQNAQTLFDNLDAGMKVVYNANNANNRFNAFRNIVNWSAKTSQLPDDSGVSQNAVYAAVRIMAAAYMAKSAISTNVETLNSALAEFDKVTAVLNGEADIAKMNCQEELFLALRNFTTTVQGELLNRAYNLPSLVVYDFGGSTHSLVAAYEVFDDAKRFAEIESRNSNLPFAIGPNVIARAA